MAEFLHLPSELKLMVFRNCSFQTCKILLLVSQDWYKHILDKTLWDSRVKQGYYRHQIQEKQQFDGAMLFKILVRHGLLALKESALDKEPEGKFACERLQTIHTALVKDHQKKLKKNLKKLAKNSVTYARLILAHPKWWDFIKEPKAAGAFVQSIMGQWPAAIYYVLENNTLKDKWLAFVIPGNVTTYDQKSVAICKRVYTAITNILDIGSVEIAWLWSTNLELRKLFSYLINDYPWQLSSCVHKIIESGDEQIARLWTTDTALNGLLTQMVGGYTWGLYLCIREIVPSGGAQVAHLWSTQLTTVQLLASMVDNPSALFKSIRVIVQVGGKQVAQLWCSNTKLCDIIVSIENAAFRLECLNLLIKVGGDHIRKLCLAHPRFVEDLVSIQISHDTATSNRNLAKKIAP